VSQLSGPGSISKRQIELVETVKGNAEAHSSNQYDLKSQLPVELQASPIGTIASKSTPEHEQDANEASDIKLGVLKHNKAKLIYQMKLDELQKKLELQILIERLFALRSLLRVFSWFVFHFGSPFEQTNKLQRR